MPWTVIYPVIIWGVVVIPLTALFWFKRPADKLTTILFLLDYALVNLFCLLVINWALVNYWLRVLPILFFFLLILRIILDYQTHHTPFLPSKATSSLILLTIGLVILVVAGYANYRVLLSLKHEGDHVLMLFPVRNGLYVIVNGGNGLDGTGMNNNFRPWFGSEVEPDKGKAYGISIMRMGIRGNLTQGGNYTHSYLKYLGYNDMVYSPCMGRVIYVEDGHPEVEVFEQGATLGNYVVIQCADYFITLGNLRNGSIDVKVDEWVSMERFIGRVGNSGTPAIPHLYVHATKGGWRSGEGEPVPMLFPGLSAVNKFFVRNDLTISNKGE